MTHDPEATLRKSRELMEQMDRRERDFKSGCVWSIVGVVFFFAAWMFVPVWTRPWLAERLWYHPNEGALWGSVPGVLLLLVFVLGLVGLATQRADLSGPMPVATVSPLAKVLGVAGWIGFSGVMVAFSSMFSKHGKDLADYFPDLPSHVFGTFGFVLLLGYLGLVALAVVPAALSASNLRRSPFAVTGVVELTEDPTQSVRLILEPGFFGGAVCDVIAGGEEVASIAPGQALGLRTKGHSMTLQVVPRGQSRVKLGKVVIDLAQGVSTTVVVRGLRSRVVSVTQVPIDAEFEVTEPRFLSRAALTRTGDSQTVGPPPIHRVFEVGPSEREQQAPPLPRAQASEPAPYQDVAASALSHGESSPRFEAHPMPIGGAEAFGAVEAKRLPSVPRSLALIAAVWLASVIVFGLLAQSMGALGGGQSELGFFITLFTGAWLVGSGAVLEVKRAVLRAPLARAPQGLVLVALGAAGVVCARPLFQEAASTSDPWAAASLSILFVPMVFISELRYGNFWRSVRHVSSWSGQSLRATVVRKHGKGAAVRILSATPADSVAVSLDGRGVDDRLGEEVPAVIVAPGLHQVEVVFGEHAAHVEVTVFAGQTVTVRVGATPERLLWLVPRQRFAVATADAPVIGMPVA